MIAILFKTTSIKFINIIVWRHSATGLFKRNFKDQTNCPRTYKRPGYKDSNQNPFAWNLLMFMRFPLTCVPFSACFVHLIPSILYSSENLRTHELSLACSTPLPWRSIFVKLCWSFRSTWIYSLRLFLAAHHPPPPILVSSRANQGKKSGLR